MSDPLGNGNGLVRSILPAALSAALAAGGAFWAMNGTVVRVDENSHEHDRRIVVLEAASYERTAAMAALRARQDGVERTQTEADERLRRIEDKVDRLLEREHAK